MAAAGRAVDEAEDRVDMDTGLAVIAGGHVADGAEHLALFGDLDRLVGLHVEVEPADRGLFESAYGGQRGSLQPGLRGEGGDGRERLLAEVENKDVSALAGVLPDQFDFMAGSSRG